MTRFSFKIGTGTGAMVYTENLPVPITVGLAKYKPYQDVDELADISDRGQGPAEITWRMGFTTRAQRDQMRIFCPGASATVYIDSTVNDDTSYHTFKTEMHWPLEEDRWAGRLLDVLWRFTVLEKLT